jgi:CRP-like cAMP-binding protein
MRRISLMPEAAARLAEYGLELSALTGCGARAYEAGETLIHVGSYIDNMLLILEGRAKVCHYTANGRSLILCYASSGFMGDLEAMCGIKNSTTVAAMTDLICLAIPWRVNEAYLRGNPVFLNALCQDLANKLLYSGSHAASAALRSCEGRLCAYLLEFSYKGVFSELLTETASYVGMSYRHMLRILNRLCREGLLEKGSSGYRILDPAGLEARIEWDVEKERD